MVETHYRLITFTFSKAQPPLFLDKLANC